MKINIIVAYIYILYLIGSLSHHLLSTNVPDCWNSHHPIELNMLHVKATFTNSLIQLILEVLENECDHIHQVVLLITVDGADWHVPVHVL